MPRTAIVTPHSLGALEAYRTIIKDISRVLGDPVIDMSRLFFAVMIQSGIEQFVVPENHPAELIPASLAENRISVADYGKVDSDLRHLSEVFDGSRRESLSEADERELHGIAAFVQDLYLAAVFNRPVVTVTERPAVECVRDLLREDVAIIVEELLRRVDTLHAEAPVTHLDVAKEDLRSFQTIVESDLFRPFVERQAMFERFSHGGPSVSRDLAIHARTLVQRFPSLISTRSTTIRALEAVPQLVDLVGGKALGAIAKPFSTALSAALGREQRLVLYSFYPTWRRIWDSKLDTVRLLLAHEQAARSNKRLQPTAADTIARRRD